MTDPEIRNSDYDVQLDGLPESRDPDGLQARLPFEVIASQFLEEHRNGSSPSIETYAKQYPKLAADIREYFPMVLAMERWKSDREASRLRQQVPTEFQITQLGECRIVREIGRGGMGVVFEARRGPQQKRVAVKLLPWKFAVPRWRERFEREAQTVARLRHRHIVPVHDFGEHEGYCYYVMEFVQGVSLDWIIRRLRDRQGIVYADEIVRVHDVASPELSAGVSETAAAAASGTEAARKGGSRRGLHRDSWKGIATIAVQAAQALHYAHGQSTLHNDIKPANLLLDASGHVWITDFGVAQTLQRNFEGGRGMDDDRLTGTLRFMAPERFEGHGDPRSDVYSLGVTLYELTTLHPAFPEQDRAELLEHILRGHPVPPREVTPRIPRDLEAVILRALQTRPERRYATASDLAADLLRFLNGERVTARRSRLWPFRR